MAISIKSSRKSSSKKSSIPKSITNYNMNTDKYIKVNFVDIIFNIFILYYITNLEDITCNCIRDWRHDYIKYLAIFNITMNILLIFGLEIKLKNIAGILNILTIVNIYAFYTYIGDLNDTQCECAVSKQKNLNDFLYIWRYVMVIVPIIYILFLFYMISNQYGK